MTKPHLLILQDDDFVADEWHDQLSPYVDITWGNAHNALRLLKKNEETISMVVVDGYITPDPEATTDLIEKIYDANPDLDFFVASSNDHHVNNYYYQWTMNISSRQTMPSVLREHFSLEAAPMAQQEPETITSAEYKPKILCVEDLRQFQQMWKEAFGDKAEIVQAYTLKDAFKIIEESLSSFDIIVMDACVPGDDPTTPPLVRKIRELGFAGPILAASGSSMYRNELVKAGCSHDTGGKENVGFLVLKLIPEIIKSKIASQNPVNNGQPAKAYAPKGMS